MDSLLRRLREERDDLRVEAEQDRLKLSNGQAPARETALAWIERALQESLSGLEAAMLLTDRIEELEVELASERTRRAL